MKSWFKGGAFLALLMITCNISYGELPKGIVTIGEKAYDIKFANDDKNVQVIRDAIKEMKEGQEIFVKNNRGSWFKNNGEDADKSQIPQIKYIKEDGSIVVYGEHDGNVISQEQFRVMDISFIEGDKFEVIFSQPVKEEEFSELIKVSGKNAVKKFVLNERKDRVVCHLEKAIEKDEETFEISIEKGIKNNEGSSLLEDIKETIIVIKSQSVSNRTFEENVAIVSENFEGYANDFKKEVHLTGNNGEFRDSKAAKIVLNPGKDGEYMLSNVESTEVSILSGADHSIIIDDSKLDKVLVSTETNTRVKSQNNSVINETEIAGDAILESKDNGFKTVKTLASESGHEVVLIGSFEKVIAENNSSVKALGNSIIKELVTSGDITIDGNVEKLIASEKDSNITLLSNAVINTMDVNEKSVVEMKDGAKVVSFTGDSKVIENIKNEEKDNPVPIIPGGNNGYDKGFVRSEVTVKDINLKMTKYTNPEYINKIKYYRYNIVIDLGSTSLSVNEKLGIGVKVLDSKNNLVDMPTVKSQGGILKIGDLRIPSGSGSIILNLENKGIVRFEI